MAKQKKFQSGSSFFILSLLGKGSENSGWWPTLEGQGHHQTFAEALTRTQVCTRSICTQLYWDGKKGSDRKAVSGKCPATSYLSWKSRLRKTQSVFKLSEREDISKKWGLKLGFWLGEHSRVQAPVCSVCNSVLRKKRKENRICFSSYRAFKFVITNWEKKSYFNLIPKMG